MGKVVVRGIDSKYGNKKIFGEYPDMESALQEINRQVKLGVNPKTIYPHQLGIKGGGRK
jgi:hypothetical protein